MGPASTIGLDIAKRVFQAHGADASGYVVFRKRLMRTKLLEVFAAQRPCMVAMETCAGAHHWAREIGELGHTVRLIPPGACPWWDAVAARRVVPERHTAKVAARSAAGHFTPRCINAIRSTKCRD